MSGPNEDVARAVLRAHVGRELRFEYVVPGGLVRADAIAVSLESLDGYEIKTAVDSHKRLARQVQGYQRYFDRCWLFTAPKHADVDLPPWWGLVVFDAEPFPALSWAPGWTHEEHEVYHRRFIEVVANAEVTVLREASQSPEQEPRALWATMWAGEARAVLAALGDGHRSAWHFERAIGRLSLDQLRTLARWTLVNRDPRLYPFSKKRAISWASQVSALLGLGWEPPAPPEEPEKTEPQLSLFAGVSS